MWGFSGFLPLWWDFSPVLPGLEQNKVVNPY